jgi:hypothetical protein
MNFASGLVLMILFMFVAFSTTSVDVDNQNQSKVKLLKFSIRFLQLVFILLTALLMYEIITYLSTGNMDLISSGFIDLNYSSMNSGYEIILVTFSILIISINFFIMEIMYSIVSDFDSQFKFSLKWIKSIKIVSNLFIIRILVQVLMNAIVFGSLTLSIEYIFIYALMIVLINIFIKAMKVQEDSDLTI